MRKGGARAAHPAVSPKEDDNEDLEETRAKLEQWMGVGSRPMGVSASEKLSGIPRHVTVQHQMTDEEKKDGSTAPKSILRKPNYSGNLATVGRGQTHNDTEVKHHQQSTSSESKMTSVFKQSQIVERDISNLKSEDDAQPRGSAAAVEGYEPKFDHNKRLNSTQKEQGKLKSDSGEDKEDGKEQTADEEPLIFNSMADMMETVGTLPPQDSADQPQMLEANISFSCMTPEEYQHQMLLQEMSEQEAQSGEDKKTKKAAWKDVAKPPAIMADEDVCKLDEGYTGSNPVEEDGEENDYGTGDGESDHGNGFFDLLGGDGSDEESVNDSRQFQPRAFRMIWECLSPLITHESVDFLKRLRVEHESSGSSGYLMTAIPTDDLAASRSNGFMAMIRMYLSRSLQEVGKSTDMRRTAEQRLLGLIYTFNFSRPVGKLETAHWRALTCILLEIIFFLDTDYTTEEGMSKLPASVKATGMTVDEYQYLAKNTIRTFDIPDPVLEIPNLLSSFEN